MKIIEAINEVIPFVKNAKDFQINEVKMDSRTVEEGDLFFAINNGNSYVKKVLDKNPALVIYDDSKLKIDNPRAVLVKDTVGTLQEIARVYRNKLDIKIISITGTSGKTSTKDITYTLLSEEFSGIKTQGNYNNHIGLPYTILQLKEHHEIAVLEMGMSSMGEIDKLCKIASPDYGIITNIGESHLEHLKTLDNVFKAKSEMLKYLSPENVFVLGDDEFLKRVKGVKIGENKSNDHLISSLEESLDGVTFNLNSEKFTINLQGFYNAYNASLAIALSKKLGLNNKQIREGLKKLKLSAMRYEKKEIKNYMFINDAYNAEPLSVKSALKSFGRLYNETYKVVVLGDMLELGEKSKEYHESLLKDINETKLDLVFLYGDEMKALKSKAKSNQKIKHFETKEEIKEELMKIENKVTILLKGSRGMKLEEIIFKEGE